MATELKSMKLSAREREQMAAPASTSAEDAPRYPWGLQLHLEHEQLETLDLEALPAVNAVVTLVARAKVTSVSARENEGGTSRSVSLQITDLCVEPGTRRNLADVLYPDTKA